METIGGILLIEIRLSVGYDEYEEGIRMSSLIEKLASSADGEQLSILTIGDWGQAYENSPDSFLETLISHKDSFPNLTKLFIGDMGFEECEVSWINQTNLSPLLAAFPNLQSLSIKGSQELSLQPLVHDKLQELVIICGGLPKSVLEEITSARLPELKRLELYLGVEDYGFDGGIEDVLPLMKGDLFPKLTYLGLKDSEIQDEIAVAIADAPILDQLDTLDLSYGTLSDAGGEALLASERIKKLKHLNLSYHYMTGELLERWKNSGLSVDVTDQQEADEDDWRYPFLTE
jgi:Leucine-rich repeat (LRR) protein